MTAFPLPVSEPLHGFPPTATDAYEPFADSPYADEAIVLAANDALVGTLIDDFDVDLEMQALVEAGL